MFQGNLPDFHNMEHVAKIIDYLEQFDDKTWFRLQRKPKETVTVSGEAFKCQKTKIRNCSLSVQFLFLCGWTSPTFCFSVLGRLQPFCFTVVRCIKPLNYPAAPIGQIGQTTEK